MSEGKYARRRAARQDQPIGGHFFPGTKIPTLPPDNVVKLKYYNSHKQQDLLETPLDEYGCVDMKKFLGVVKGAVDPKYNWWAPHEDDHHLQWPKNKYAKFDEEHGFDKHHPFAIKYRNLPINMLTESRVFHNFVHRVMIPPPIPPEPVMHYKIMAMWAIRTVLGNTNKIAELDEDFSLSDKQKDLQKYSEFYEFCNNLENIKEKVPIEFNLLNMERLNQISELRNLDDATYQLKQAGEWIGKLAVPNSVDLGTIKPFRLPPDKRK